MFAKSTTPSAASTLVTENTPLDPRKKAARARKGDIFDAMGDADFRRTTGAIAAMAIFGAAVIVPADYAAFVIAPHFDEYVDALMIGKEIAGQKLDKAKLTIKVVGKDLNAAGVNSTTIKAAVKAFPANEKLAQSGLKCAAAALDDRAVAGCRP